jgi:hypothetical protein
VDDTGGRFYPIAEESGADCVVTDFAAALEELGQLLSSLLEQFVLRGVPDVDTITVFVEGKEVVRASETVDDDGSITYGSGWSFVAETNAVKFHGDAVPDYNAPVRIYYLPLEGMPRELPF